MMTENKYELIKFEDGDFTLNVNVSPKDETVWLNRHELSLLFDRDIKTIGKHINNILKEEYKNIDGVIAKIATTANDGKTYMMDFYNLDIILSVGYRVKSERGILFRRWANSILKQYLLHGQVINETRCLAHSDNMIKLNNSIETINARLDNVESKLDSLTFIDAFKIKFFMTENYMKDIRL